MANALLPVDLGDDLPPLGLLLVARGGVDDQEVVGGDGAQRDVVGRIGLRRPVISRPRAVQHALVLERGQLAAHLDGAEALGLADRQLEGRALEVVHQDERVVGIDPRVLGRRAEEIVGMRRHELIERRAGRDQHRRRGFGAPPGPARLLPHRGDRSRVAGQDRGVQVADVDAELERVRGHDAERLARRAARAPPPGGDSAGNRRDSRARCRHRRSRGRPRPA